MEAILIDAVEHSKAVCGRVLLEYIEVALIRILNSNASGFAHLASTFKTKDIEELAAELKPLFEDGENGKK